MNETLQSLQLVHRLLMTVSAAIIILLLSHTDEVGPYQSAYTELRELRNTLPELKKLKADKINKYYHVSNIPAMIREVAPSIEPEKIEFIEIAENSRFAAPELDVSSSKAIDSYYEYIRLAPYWDHALVRTFNREQFVDQFRDFLTRSKVKRIDQFFITVLKDDSKDYASIAFPIVPRKCSFYVATIDKVRGRDTYIEGQPSIDCTTSMLAFSTSEKELLIARKLIIKNNQEYLALPAISAVWDTAKGQDVRTLEGVLQRKAVSEKRESENKIDVAGLSLKATTAVTVGPLGVLILLCFLLALVFHVENAEPKYHEDIRSFPWFGLWHNMPGFVISFSTVVVAPCFAGCALILVSLPRDRRGIAIAGGFAVASLVLSTLIMLHSYRITDKVDVPDDDNV